MAAPPIPHDWTLLEQATSANLQSLTDAIDFLQKPPRCRATRTTNLTLANGVLTVVGFNGEDYDPNGFHSTVTNNSRITPNISGLYQVRASAQFASQSGTARLLEILKNGSVVAESNIDSASLGSASFNISKDVMFNGTTDFVEMQVRQSSGGNLDLIAGAATFLEVRWVAIDETTAF